MPPTFTERCDSRKITTDKDASPPTSKRCMKRGTSRDWELEYELAWVYTDIILWLIACSRGVR